jgi:hypothetical protein
VWATSFALAGPFRSGPSALAGPFRSWQVRSPWLARSGVGPVVPPWPIRSDEPGGPSHRHNATLRSVRRWFAGGIRRVSGRDCDPEHGHRDVFGHAARFAPDNHALRSVGLRFGGLTVVDLGAARSHLRPPVAPAGATLAPTRTPPDTRKRPKELMGTSVRRVRRLRTSPQSLVAAWFLARRPCGRRTWFQGPSRGSLLEPVWRFNLPLRARRNVRCGPRSPQRACPRTCGRLSESYPRS